MLITFSMKLFFCTDSYAGPVIATMLITMISAGSLSGNSEQLSLDEALRHALEHNTLLSIQDEATGIAKQEFIVQDAAFDPIFSITSGIAENKNPIASSVLTGAERLTKENQDYRIGVDKQLKGLGTNVTLESTLERSKTNSSNATLNPETTSSVGILVSQPLLEGRGKINLAPLARARVRSRQAYLRLQEEILNTTEQTVNRYWLYAFSKAQLENQRSQLQFVTELVEETEHRVQFGLATSAELFSAQAEQALEQEQTLNRRQNTSDALDSLRKVIGKLDEDSLQEEVDTTELPERDYQIPDLYEIVDKALAFSRVRREQLEELKLAEIDSVVARNAKLPDLRLNASGAYLGRDESVYDSFNNTSQREAYRWGASIELIIPWQQRADHAKYRIAQKRRKQAEIALRDVKENIILDVRRAWRELNTSMANFKTAQKVLRFSRRAHEREQARYSEGLATFRATLDTLRDLDNARTRALQSQLRLVQAETRLDRLTGELLDRHGYTWQTLEADLPPDERWLR